MAHFLVQAKPTPDFWSHALASPDDVKGQWVRGVVARLKGQVHGMWFSFGEYDVAMICEMPDGVSAAALSLAYSASGTVVSVRITPLLSIDEGTMALRMASGQPAV